MANKVLGITVDIEGKTSGLTKSLQEANSSISKTTSALKDVDKALQLDPTNVELLAQKEELLNKQIEQTSEKLDIMRQVAEDANDALARGDISQEQYASLQAEIVKTESALSGLESEADGSADALEETGDEAEEAGIDMEAFGEAAEAAGEVAVAAFEAVVVAAAAVGAAVIGAMAEAGTALVNATMNTSQLADELLTLEKTTGLSTDTLQELNYASELLDVSTSTVTGSITKLEKQMGSAANGTQSAIDKFDELGIAFQDSEGNMRDAEDVFWDAIDALGQMDNETERDAAAMELFGKSAKELNPLIEAGSEAFASLADEAHEVGYVMDGETLDAFGALDDNMQRLNNITDAVSNSMGQILLPILTDLSGEAVDLLGDFSGALAETGGDVDKMAGVIEKFAPRAVSLIESSLPKIIGVVEQVANAILPVVISLAPQLLELAGSLIESLANSIAENADALISGFTTLFESVVNAAVTLLPVLIPLAIDLIMTLVNALMENGPLLVEGALSIIMTLCDSLLAPDNVQNLVMAATQIITGLLEGLTTALPILIPAALNAILTIVDTLLSGDCLAQILSAALTLITTLAGALIQYLPELISRLPEIILGIVEFLTGDALPDIISAGMTLLLALITNLPEIIVSIVEGLIELVAGMVEYFTGDGAADLLDAGQEMFDGIINSAAQWGSDLIQQFIDGIKQMWENLKSTLNDVAQLVKNILGFSVPEEGPLAEWGIKNPGTDMLKLYSEGIKAGMADFETTLDATANIINRDMSPYSDYNSGSQIDYTSNLTRIESALASFGGSASIVIPVYLGGDHIDTVVVDALDRYNYRSGGAF